jgi:putative DNA-binding protein
MSLGTQRLFAGAFFGADRRVPDGLTSWSSPRAEGRFAVYRNNVAAGLIGALASRFPVTEKIVGEAFFAAMAQAFIAQHPPKSPVLLSYGDDFAGFVEAFGPAAELPYLPDVIRLEAARGSAYHAADQSPLEPATLEGLDGDALAALRFVFHPSVSVTCSSHPIVTIWAMNSGEMELSPIEPWLGEDALVVRPHLTVAVRRLPPGGAKFLTTLISGATLAAAAEFALGAAPEFDLAANLAGVLQSGAFTAIA